MKDEIKEILELIGNNYYYGNISEIQKNKYCDYITNLQEENEYSNHCNEELRKKIINLEYKIERLEEDNKELRIQISAREEEYIKLQEELKTIEEKWNKDKQFSKYRTIEMLDYKSRCEKAIEDIDLVIELIKQQPTEDDTWILNRLNGFKYLLQGEDKDE